MPTKRTKRKTAKSEARAALSLIVQYAVGSERIAAALPTRAQFRRWVRAALPHHAVITLRIVGETEGRRLNTAFRRKRKATNVLSFNYEDGGAQALSGGAQALGGDIVLCAPVIAREAREQGKTPAAHYAHLTVHGMLHLQGYDHQRDSDANRMERRETAILQRLGYADPYRR